VNDAVCFSLSEDEDALMSTDTDLALSASGVPEMVCVPLS